MRVLVTGGGAAGVYSFDVAASGITEQVDVRVLPQDITGTLSSATPACNQPVTYTVEPPYQFTAASQAFDESGVVPLNQSLSEDGQSITFTSAPGYSGPITITGVELDFLPGAPVDLTSNETFTVGTDCGFTNQDDPFSAAPPVNSPALGTVFSFFDAGNIAVFQYYVLNVGQAGNYSIELHWNNTSDVDLVVYDAGTLDALCVGFTLNNPEVCTLDLPVGQYYLESGLYSGAAPEIQWVTIDATGGN